MKYIILPRNPLNKSRSIWERQFLLQDIFNCANIGDSDFIEYRDIRSFIKRIKRDNQLKNTLNNNILIVSTYQTPKWISILVKLIKPKVMVLTSDEYGGNKKYHALANKCELMLRQYSHRQYPQYKNTIYLPLGYSNGMFETNYLELPVKVASERKLKWSWVGNVHSNSNNDREFMLEKFKTLEPNYYGNKDNTEMRELYRDSVFVPCGRGRAVLNCFRLYEASSCGAIPVVVGDSEEIDTTFAYEKSPPWLFFETWEDAVLECTKLLEDKKYLDNLSNQVHDWWVNRVSEIGDEIRKFYMEAEPSK
jgi:hypothetical protein